MMTDDEDGEYIPKEVVRVENTAELSRIPLPPGGVIKSAFLIGIQQRSINSALRAYTNNLRELGYIIEAESGIKTAQVRHNRVVDLLDDSDEIIAEDRALRREKRARAEERLSQAKHELDLNNKRRLMEKRLLDQKYDKFMFGDQEEDAAPVSQERKELKERMIAKTFKNSEVQEIMDEIRKEKGRPLTEQEEANLAACASEATKLEG